MKKILTLIITALLLASCHFPNYTHSGDVNAQINLKQGKWLLNEVEATKEIKEKLTLTAKKEFSNLLKNRFSVAKETKGILLPAKVSTNINKNTLKDIKNGTNYDFFITIKATIIANEIGDFQIGSISSPKENSGIVTVEIYNLNLLEKVYTQTVIGTLSIRKDNSDFAFAKGANNLIQNSLKRIIKNIKKNREY